MVTGMYFPRLKDLRNDADKTNRNSKFIENESSGLPPLRNW